MPELTSTLCIENGAPSSLRCCQAAICQFKYHRGELIALNIDCVNLFTQTQLRILESIFPKNTYRQHSEMRLAIVRTMITNNKKDLVHHKHSNVKPF